jgi:probable HAF family extracellular repeat protein
MRRTSLARTVAIAAIAALVGAPEARAVQKPKVIALGVPAGTAGAGVYALSGDGHTFGGWARDPVTWLQIPFGWRVHDDGTFEEIPIPDLPGGNVAGSIQGVSWDGNVMVGVSETEEGQEAIKWTPETGTVSLGELPGGAHLSYANGVSADGTVIAGYSSNELGTEATIWTADGEIRGLGVLPGFAHNSNATAISPDGRVVAGSSTSYDGVQPFVWTDETGMVGLGAVIWGFPVQALAVSDDGGMVAGWMDAPWGEAGWYWTRDEGYVAIPDFDGSDWRTWIWDIDQTATHMFGYGTDDDGDTALLWDRQNGIRKLQDVLAQDYGLTLPGWKLRGVEGITNDGRVMAGWATTPRAGAEGYVLLMPPACDNGIDDDGDGKIDFPDDPGCRSAEDNREDPQCDDAIDNDRDGLVDQDDPACAVGSTETRPACGLGAELVVVVALLRRRSRPAGRAARS